MTTTNTTQPVAKASYSGGESLPTPGSPEYTKSAELARTAGTTARVNPNTIGTSDKVANYNYEGGSEQYFNSITGDVAIGSPEESKARMDATAEKYRREAQTTTDLINSKYSSKVANDKELIANQDARARVLNTRTGVTDSGTGSTAINNVQEKGNKILAQDEASKTAEISSALGRISAMSSNEQKANEAQNRNDLVTANNLRLKNKADAEATLKSLGTSGVDLETLKTKEPDTYNTLLKTTGLSPLELEAKYSTLQGTNATKWQYKIVGDKVLSYGVDSKGQLKTQEQEIPGLSAGNFAIIKGDNGTLYKEDKNTGDITPLVNTAKPPKATVDTKNTETTQQKNEQSDALNWLARQPKFTKQDKEMFKTDESFRAWAINQAKLEKPAKGKTPTTPVKKA